MGVLLSPSISLFAPAICLSECIKSFNFPINSEDIKLRPIYAGKPRKWACKTGVSLSTAGKIVFLQPIHKWRKIQQNLEEAVAITVAAIIYYALRGRWVSFNERPEPFHCWKLQSYLN
jgi:hypothetical protein